jgi:FkbM family methyltransferase
MLKTLRQAVKQTHLAPVLRPLYTAIRDRVSREIRMDRRYNLYTRLILERSLRADSNVVDVGCNRGDILRQMRSLAPDGDAFAFEPLPAFAADLRRDFPDVNVYELALSDEPGPATFFEVVNLPEYSGLRQRDYPIDEVTLRETQVQRARLDDVLPADLPIHVIKIDVEGAELQVLRGASRTLTRHQPLVIFEHGRGAAEHYDTTPTAVFDWLADCGMGVYLLDAWLGGKRPLVRRAFVEEFNTGRNYYFLAQAASDQVSRVVVGQR